MKLINLIFSKILNKFLIMSQPRRAVLLFFLLIFTLLLANCKIVFYGVEQGIGQLKIVHNSVLIDEVLNNPNAPDSLKERLRLVQDVKNYAIDSLGLKPSKNFNTVYDQKGEPIVWIIYAAPRYEMLVHEWHFPVIGDLPYIGYFDKKEALAEAKKMNDKGFDTRVGTVTAWSTLGYFQDPILSNALFQSVGDVAELVIHELTHATLFVKGKAQFNENLATFVGETGAKKYLISKFGENSKEYLDYIGAMKDSKKIAKHILLGSKQLDSLYKSFSIDLDTIQKNKLKKAMISKIINNMDTIDLYDTIIPQNFKSKVDKINNAYFAGYITYYEKQNEFDDEYFKTYSPDLKSYIRFLITKFGK